MLDVRPFVCCFALVALLSSRSIAEAQHKETRVFHIQVNGKDAGSSTIEIREENGKTYMKGNVEVHIKPILAPAYNFRMDTEEWWREGRLANMKTITTENGKRVEVVADAKADHILVHVNGQVRSVSWECWSNSFWKLADRRFHNQKVPMLEADTGKEVMGKLGYIGVANIVVAGTPEKCFHFRVTDIAVPTDLWYDQHHRLVRQEFTESGQKTIVQLMGRK